MRCTPEDPINCKKKRKVNVWPQYRAIAVNAFVFKVEIVEQN